MNAIQSMLGDFLKSLKSKRVVTGILSIIFLAAHQYWSLEDYGITEETVQGLVITIATLIVSDTIRPFNPEKLEVAK